MGILDLKREKSDPSPGIDASAALACTGSLAGTCRASRLGPWPSPHTQSGSRTSTRMTNLGSTANRSLASVGCDRQAALNIRKPSSSSHSRIMTRFLVTRTSRNPCVDAPFARSATRFYPLAKEKSLVSFALPASNLLYTDNDAPDTFLGKRKLENSGSARTTLTTPRRA